MLPEDRIALDMDDKDAEEQAAKDKDKERRKKRRGGEVAESQKKLKKVKTAAS